MAVGTLPEVRSLPSSMDWRVLVQMRLPSSVGGSRMKRFRVNFREWANNPCFRDWWNMTPEQREIIKRGKEADEHIMVWIQVEERSRDANSRDTDSRGDHATQAQRPDGTTTTDPGPGPGHQDSGIPL